MNVLRCALQHGLVYGPIIDRLVVWLAARLLAALSSFNCGAVGVRMGADLLLYVLLMACAESSKQS